MKGKAYFALQMMLDTSVGRRALPAEAARPDCHVDEQHEGPLTVQWGRHRQEELHPGHPEHRLW